MLGHGGHQKGYNFNFSPEYAWNWFNQLSNNIIFQACEIASS